MKILTIIVTCVTVVAVSFYFFYLKEFVAEAKEETTFTVDKPYKDVIMQFTKYESTEKIVAAGGGKIVEHKWIDANLDVDRVLRPLATWTFRGSSTMRIEFETPYKKIYLDTAQTITADQDKFVSKTELAKPGNAVKFMDNTISITKDGDKTVFHVSNWVVVKQRLPPNVHDKIKKEVLEGNRTANRNTEKVIREICSAGRFTIPLNLNK
jgi:hypothetical protein